MISCHQRGLSHCIKGWVWRTTSLLRIIPHQLKQYLLMKESKLNIYLYYCKNYIDEASNTELEKQKLHDLAGRGKGQMHAYHGFCRHPWEFFKFEIRLPHHIQAVMNKTRNSRIAVRKKKKKSVAAMKCWFNRVENTIYSVNKTSFSWFFFSRLSVFDQGSARHGQDACEHTEDVTSPTLVRKTRKRQRFMSKKGTH